MSGGHVIAVQTEHFGVMYLTNMGSLTPREWPQVAVFDDPAEAVSYAESITVGGKPLTGRYVVVEA